MGSLPETERPGGLPVRSSLETWVSEEASQPGRAVSMACFYPLPGFEGSLALNVS